MVNIRGKQRYGTHMTCQGGKLVPRLIEDEADLAKRRAEMGLQPMADYFKTMESSQDDGISPERLPERLTAST